MWLFYIHRKIITRYFKFHSAVQFDFIVFYTDFIKLKNETIWVQEASNLWILMFEIMNARDLLIMSKLSLLFKKNFLLSVIHLALNLNK